MPALFPRVLKIAKLCDPPFPMPDSAATKTMMRCGGGRTDENQFVALSGRTTDEGGEEGGARRADMDSVIYTCPRLDSQLRFPPKKSI